MECNKDEAAKGKGIAEKNLVEGGTLKLPPPSQPNLFWTKCNHCGIQFEYAMFYINHNLRCPFCKHPFDAVEITASSTGQQNLSSQTPSSLQPENVRETIIKNTSSTRGRKRGSGNQILKIGGEESPSQAASKGKGAMSASNSGSSSGKRGRPLKTSRDEVNVTGGVMPGKLEMGNVGVVSGNQGESLGTEQVRASRTVGKNRGKELSRLEVRHMLMERSRMEIRKKLEMDKQKHGNSNASVDSSEKKPLERSQ